MNSNVTDPAIIQGLNCGDVIKLAKDGLTGDALVVGTISGYKRLIILVTNRLLEEDEIAQFEIDIVNLRTFSLTTRV